MAVDLLSLEPQEISRNLKGKYIMVYGPASHNWSALNTQ